MFKNYLKTAIRNLWKNKGFSAINIIGLAIGLSTCLLIILYVFDELSFDKFNNNADRIYRVNNEVKFGGNHFDLAQTPALQGPTMVAEFPEVEAYTRLQWYGSIKVRKGSEYITEERVAYGDSTLFKIFNLEVVSGNPATALAEPHSLVINETVARRYFNRTNVAGETLVINNDQNYKIGAVIKDVPQQCHFQFNVFLPFIESADSRDVNGWLSENYNTYVLLKKGTDTRKLVARMDEMMERKVGPLIKAVLNIDMKQFKDEGSYVRNSLTPLTDIHLRSNKNGELNSNGNILYVYIFSAIAFFLLVIACVNFMNLSTARSANRAKEVGVRKVLGSLRINLVQQFLTESLLISSISLVIAILLVWLLLPYFNTLAAKKMSISFLFQPFMLGALLFIAIFSGLLAGSYPAFLLSAFKPIEVLKGKLAKGFKGSWLRNGLVVFQFVVSIILITGTIIIYNQLSYIRHKDVGFDRNQVLIINNTGALKEQATDFRNELLQISGVHNATMSSYLPVNFYRSNDAFFTSPTLDQKTAISMQNWGVDENYIPTLSIKVTDGRNFSSQFPTDSSAVIVNEAAAKFLGGKDILNKSLYHLIELNPTKFEELHIVGIIKNFHFSSLKDAITPLALRLRKEPYNISARVNTANITGIIEQMRSKWQARVKTEPFSYAFMDEQFNALYVTEQRTGKIFISFASLAILIACLGLFGLVTYAAEQRTKEIGIRKVLGASVATIVQMISKDFLKLVLIASIIAFPIAWWAMTKWLQDFEYRVSIGWWVFAVAGGLTALLALCTVCFQALKAAIANPVKSLRTE